MKNKDNSFFASFASNTPLYKVDEFVNNFRRRTNKKYKFHVDVKLSRDGHEVFISNFRNYSSI